MTWFWILIWLAFSVFIIGMFSWSTIILQRQKRAWADFALKHGLAYDRRRFLDSAAVTGLYKGFDITLMSLPREADDPRDNRFVSVLELKFPQGLQDSFAIGTPAMHPFIEQFDAYKQYTIPAKGWKEEYKVYANNLDRAKDFLTADRLKHIARILSLKNADVLIMFDSQEGIVRAETIDPVQTSDKVEQVADYLIKHCKALYDSPPSETVIMNEKPLQEAIGQPEENTAEDSKE